MIINIIININDNQTIFFSILKKINSIFIDTKTHGNLKVFIIRHEQSIFKKNQNSTIVQMLKKIIG